MVVTTLDDCDEDDSADFSSPLSSRFASIEISSSPFWFLVVMASFPSHTLSSPVLSLCSPCSVGSTAIASASMLTTPSAVSLESSLTAIKLAMGSNCSSLASTPTTGVPDLTSSSALSVKGMQNLESFSSSSSIPCTSSRCAYTSKTSKEENTMQSPHLNSLGDSEASGSVVKSSSGGI